MILELAELTVAPDDEAAFLAAVEEATPIFRRAAGCLSMRLDRIVERPGHFMLVVGWETIEAHEVGFRGSEDFKAWRALAGPHFAAPPQVVHIEAAYTGF